MADNEDRTFAPNAAEANRDGSPPPKKDRRPEAGKVQSANPSETKEPGPPKLPAEEVNDAEGDLGEGTPANVDIHKLGQEDNPQEDWGEPADEGATFSSNHTRRGEKTEAERGQGNKTRAANKDQVSRRT